MKNALVVDASVAIKWFLPEIYSQEASLVLRSGLDLLAPDLIWSEFASALRKKVRHKEVTDQEAHAILKDFMRFPLQTFSSKLLLYAAWELAHKSGATIYDSLYLALANSRKCSVITADRKFYDSVSNGTVPLKMLWVEDVV